MKKFLFLITCLFSIVAYGATTPVGYWKFDEKSGVSTNIATTGSSSFDVNSFPSAPNVLRGIVGPIGFYRALQSTNTASYTATAALDASTGTDTALQIDSTEGLTITFWVNPTPGGITGTYSYAMSQGKSSGFPNTFHNYAVAFNTNSVAFDFGDSTQRIVANTSTNWTGLTSSWHHVAVSVNPSATLGVADFKFYLDGSLLNTNNNSLVTGTLGVGLSIATNNGPLVAMNRPDGSSLGSFIGGFDELRIYNTVLAGSEISSLASIPSSVTTTNSLWLGSTSRIYDQTGIQYFPNNQTSTSVGSITAWLNADTNAQIALNKLPASVTNALANAVTNAVGTADINTAVTNNVLTVSIKNTSPLFPLASNNGSALTNGNATTFFVTGTIPDARLNSNILRTTDIGSTVQAHSANLDTLAARNAANLTNANASALFGSGTIPNSFLAASLQTLANDDASALTNGNATAFFGSGNIPDTFLSAALQALSVGDASALTNGNATAFFATGNIPDTFLSANVDLLDGTRPWTGNHDAGGFGLSNVVNFAATGDVLLDGLLYPATDGTTNQVIVTDGAGHLSFATPATPFDASNFVVGEVPYGLIDGTNTSFFVVNEPLTGKFSLYENGLRLTNPTDYSIATSNITFVIAPPNGALLQSDYIK